MIYYKLTIPGFNQYKFAWAEMTENANVSQDFPKCPQCHEPVGVSYWLPPYDIVLKQPKKIGDFVGGVIGVDLIVSQNFKDKYLSSGLTGIVSFIQLNIVKAGVSTKKEYNILPLWGATVEITYTQVDYKKMEVTWFSEPEENICKLCCPGGGGIGGTYEKYQKIVFKKETLTKNDFFIPINFPGNIMLSQNAKAFLEINDFSNYQLVPDYEAKENIYK
ncbi:hypothetical protein [Gynurincola endophyticus]|uniref:hypothetical protein n=1 Tax=Gynurincola endophyticus TaxID=2479004 RepID=UPI000F8CD4E8|nr:hypothetical protein [Gynurincola endophyticus]